MTQSEKDKWYLLRLKLAIIRREFEDEVDFAVVDLRMMTLATERLFR